MIGIRTAARRLRPRTPRTIVLPVLLGIAVLAGTILAGPGGGTPAAAAPQPQFPEPSGYVNDYTGLLNGQEKAALERIITDLERQTTAEIAVAVVQTAKPLDPKMYAVELFERWGIGKKGKDNGLLVLLAMEERRIEVEVGYGLEPYLLDSQVTEVLDRYVIPRFKEGKFGEGLIAGVSEYAGMIRGRYSPEVSPPVQDGGATGQRATQAPGDDGSGLSLIGVLVLLMLGMLGLAVVVAAARSLAPRCPGCRSRLIVTDRIVRRATFARSGEGVKVYECPNCGYRREQRYRIFGGFPPPPIGGPFGGRPWGGGHGGGGFGGFGGFGGGRSGGGGGGRGW